MLLCGANLRATGNNRFHTCNTYTWRGKYMKNAKKPGARRVVIVPDGETKGEGKLGGGGRGGGDESSELSSEDYDDAGGTTGDGVRRVRNEADAPSPNVESRMCACLSVIHN